MAYDQKNAIKKGARKDEAHLDMLLLSFLRGYSVGEVERVVVAYDLGFFTKPTIHRFYSYVRSQLFDGPEFFDSIRDDLIEDDKLRGVKFLLERISTVGQPAVYKCAYECRYGHTPKQIHMAASKNSEMLDVMQRVRARCRECLLRLDRYLPVPSPPNTISRADGGDIDFDDPNYQIARALAQLADRHQESTPFDALSCWLSILVYLGKFRRVNRENIGRLLRCAIVQYAIDRTTMWVPRTLSYEGSTYTFDTGDDDSDPFRMYNALEERIFTKARRFLEAHQV